MAARFKIGKEFSLFQILLFMLFILTGLLLFWIIKDDLSAFILQGKTFSGRNTLYQFIFIASFLIVFLIVSIAGLFGIKKLYRQEAIRKLLHFNNLPSLRMSMYLSLVLVLAFISIYFVNNVFSAINTTNWSFYPPDVPFKMVPAGNDFRVGVYKPVKMMLAGMNIYNVDNQGTAISQYPPFMNLLFLPYQLFDENTAYLLHVFVLFFSNLFSLLIAAYLAYELFLSKTGLDRTLLLPVSITLFFGTAIWTFSSYGFQFSIERGNCDAIAVLFSLLAILVLIKRPEKIWLQVLLLSIAVHIKIYPAALFVIWLIKYGKKVILPVIVVNVVFLLSLGPINAIDFVKTILGNSSSPLVWIGNHSGHSFAQMLADSYPQFYPFLFILRYLFTFIPIIIWCGSIYSIYKKKEPASMPLLVFMVTIPLMNLVPTISHDYKLVILSSALLLLFFVIITHIYRENSILDYLQLFLLFIILFFLGRSYTLNDPSSFFINQKYVAILAVQILMYINVERVELNTVLPVRKKLWADSPE